MWEDDENEWFYVQGSVRPSIDKSFLVATKRLYRTVGRSVRVMPFSLLGVTLNTDTALFLTRSTRSD